LGDNKCSGTAWAELVDPDGKIVNASYYKWSTGETTPSATSICPNTTYSVSIKDYNGCTTASSFAISDFTNPIPNYGYWNYENKDSNYIFKYLANNPGYTVKWNFSDGSTYNGSYIPHTFLSDKGNWVELVVTDTTGKVVKQEVIDIPSNITKINQPLNDNQVSIYPIPANDVLNVKFSKEAKNGMIEIIDFTGRIITSENIKSGELIGKISIGQLPKGMYICRVKASNEVLRTTKIIIQ
jgi:hypothetical protein